MKLNSVNSTQLSRIGYEEIDAEAGTGNVLVEFPAKASRASSFYRYSGVPKDVYLGVLQADSHGKAFTQTIKDSYPNERVSAAEAEAYRS